MHRRLPLAALTAAAVAVPALALGASAAMSPVVSAKLRGSAEAPKKGPAAGSGVAVLHLNANKGQVCWEFKNVKGIDKPLAAHIHEAPARKAGPVVVPLGKAYKAKGCVTAPKKAEVAEIEEEPDAYYVNVHTAKYPDGAIRGQLVAGMVGR